MSPSPIKPALWLLISAVLIVQSSAAYPQRASLPDEHFSVEKPKKLSPLEAQALYEQLVDDMVDAYALSRDPSAETYRRWQRFNKAPYPSATHGSRYVNNYGNRMVQSYGGAETVDALPEGAILAKDSFAVTADGDVFPGPLFLMEKMAPGFDPKARDWRYSMIMPDGSFFGMTGGDNDARVRFCIACHETAGDENDHLFFVPDDFRN